MVLGLSTLFIENRMKGFDSIVQLLSSPHTKHVEFFEIVNEGTLKLGESQAKILGDFSETGTKFTLHSSYCGINIASIDKARREASLRGIMRSIDMAERIEAINIVVHSGTVDGGINRSVCSANNFESLSTLKDYSTSRGMHIALENDTPHPYALLIKPADFKEFYSECNVRIPLVLDVGHANMSSSLAEFVEMMADSIVEVHVHDNDGSFDGHLEIGKGSVEFNTIKPLFLRPSTLFVVESIEGPFRSFDRLVSMRKQALSL